MAKKTNYNLLCAVCLNTFVSKNNYAKYCSYECEKIARKPLTKKCSKCNTFFIASSNRSAYCSNCKGKGYIERTCKCCKERFTGATTFCPNCKHKKNKAICPVCNKTFEYPITQNNRIFCSIDCGKKHNKNVLYQCTCVVCKKNFMARHKSTKFCSDECKNHKTEKTCMFCGRIFLTEFYKLNSKKYCSSTCSAEFHKNPQSSFKNQAIKEKLIREQIEDKVRDLVVELIKDLHSQGNTFNEQMINYYNINFTEGIREQVLQRDDYTCQICGRDTELHVHHRIKRKNGGSHTLENLITLCVSCHRAIETGDQSYAIRKCTRNAFKNNHIPIKLNKKLNQTEKTSKLRLDLEKIFQLLSEGEVNEAMVLIDEVIEQI